MSLSSLEFVIFTAVCVTGYYRIPKKLQWIWLLVFSYIYYMAAGPALVVFLLLTTATTYYGALRAQNGSRAAAAVTLVLNFGLLAYLKYTNFLLANINLIFRTSIPMRSLLLPLGISFYMFQTTGYVLDVFWKKCPAEKNFLKFALFASFFPQIMQGPIGRYSKLAPQLTAEHSFDPVRLERGMWRVVWGLFKKMVVADNAVLYVNAIFDNYAAHPGLGIEAVLMYGLQLYADFSGGVDVVLGIAEMLGITMDENFRRPFFAVSITDFWHRWHITLGTWMKDYLFYPLSLSKWMGRFGKWCRARFGKTTGRALPICLANIIVFLVVGIWHGPEWHFILYGLYNGLLIGAAGLLAKPMREAKKALRIPAESRGWHIFQVIRTFALVTFSWFFDRAADVPQAFRMIGNIFRHNSFSISVIEPDAPRTALLYFLIILFGAAVMAAVSLLSENKKDVRKMLMQAPAMIRVTVFAAVVLSLGLLGNFRAYGGFIYANF